ncbi:MAG TPA: tRNA (N6-threonylcarbamoyladenosine(37)-N6)-methyltransferase TrmO [Candidatus Sabulitectum sp.]|nr:tRNA (N6-threonylcarbamoyladenosine(37)-N6)-methyltransferase TrmO [Candidatus Sabulitectum sp.]
MKNEYSVRVIGSVSLENGFAVNINREFRKGLKGLEEFSHAIILWVFDRARWDGGTLEVKPPYRSINHETGVFSTRSPFRPSPVAISTGGILSVNEEEGLVLLDWIDAMDCSPVIDIKPYHPSMDRVSRVCMPEWCAHWPRSREESGAFDWEREFSTD